MTEKERLEYITRENVLEALQRAKDEGVPSARESSAYDLVFEEITYPPKYITSLAGFFSERGQFILGSSFGGGEQSACFAKLRELGFEILPKEKTQHLPTAKQADQKMHYKYAFRVIDEQLDLELFNNYFSEYIRYCKESTWLSIAEAYKFRFGRWLNERVNFDTQSDEEILALCNESQEQHFDPNSTAKGVNFIVSQKRYQDEFISLIDIQNIRRLRKGELLSDADLKDSPLSFPKFAVWAGVLMSESNMIFASDELTLGISNLFHLDDYPKSGVRAFNLANACLKDIKSAVQQYYNREASELIQLIFPGSLIQPIDLVWLVQDFILFLNRRILKSEVNYFWVNQGDNYKVELEYGIVAAPDHNLHHQKRLRELKEGDVILHYANSAIRATSVVTKEFQIKPRPYNPSGENYLIVEVSYKELERPIPVDQVKAKFTGHEDVLPAKHGPLTKDLAVVQMYICAFNEAAYNVLFGQIHYWRIGTSDEDTNYWNFMSENNVICIGWSSLGDLSLVTINDRSDIDQLLNSTGNYTDNNRVRSRKAGEIFDFYKNSKVGDIVLAQSGHAVMGIGKITSDYKFSATDGFPHQKEVEWLRKLDEEKFLNPDGSQTTFYQLTRPQLIDQIKSYMAHQENTSVRPLEYTAPVNQILYGPPGTGKTYNSINKSLEILGINTQELSRTSIKNHFDEAVEKGQIVFTTFHQSMSYEDFIEGIKPKTVGTNVVYEIKNGIFKKISDLAKDNFELSKNPESNFSEVFEMLKNELAESENNEIKIETKKTHFFLTNITDRNIEFRKASGATNHDLVITTLKEIFSGKREMQSGLAVYYYPLVEKLKQYKLTSNSSKLQNYVLIIDEINRGNVSQIFGELITLIEDSKRLGQEETITLNLPYSQEDFVVPPNLYIIGTMNTADRSVEALDTALRRRFSFVEMLPNPELLKEITIEGINLRALLQTMNERIEVLVDRDHTIGHAFFINDKNLDDLRNTFANKIIPLLQEYFYGDYGKMEMVIGSAFFEVKEVSKVKFAVKSDDFDAEGKVYHIKNLMDKSVLSDEDFTQALKQLITGQA
jgi:hypothetical protein